MGRMLGAYDEDELDRPDLNKCPDCGCFFATDACTLCGKICPEEMRAGNRAPVKKSKKRNSSGRVQFVPWYHSWWFIAIMLWWMFPVGVVLFFTSPYSKKWKIILTAVAVVAVFLFYGGLGWIMNGLFSRPLVNDDLSRTAYTERCTEMTADEFYRQSTDVGVYVTMDLTVVGQMPGSWFGEESDTVFYRCRGTDGETDIILRDCILADRQVLREGDIVRVWGESAGMVAYSSGYGHSDTLPCLYTAYCVIIG